MTIRADTLFVTHRAQCPDCGAPLSLDNIQPLAQCTYCGGESAVQRRLRTLEASIEGMQTASGPATWKPPHQVQGIEDHEAHCPACGVIMESDAHHKILRCTHCRTQSKVESRLVRKGAGGTLAIDELARTWALADARTARRTHELVEQIVAEKNPAQRLALARKLEEWQYINPVLASHLPRLIAVMKTGGPAIELALGNALSMLLCEGDKALRNAVVRAAEMFVFDPAGSPELLFALGLGSGVCIKLLLDAANHAADAGSLELACTALWGINLMFERNYPERDLMAGIILYRLLYMRGPVQAWALELARGQMGLGYRYPTPTLLRFMDDCFFERPELLPQIEKCFYNGSAATADEYLQRLDFIDELVTQRARAAGLRQIYDPPQDVSEEFLSRVLARLLAYAADPQLADAACTAIKWIIDMGPRPRAAVEQMIATGGDSLPEPVRRDYLRRVDKSPHLTPLPPQYWQPERPSPKIGLEKQLEEWAALWKQGLTAAVDARRRRQEAARSAATP